MNEICKVEINKGTAPADTKRDSNKTGNEGSNNGAKIFVGNLAYNTNWQVLKDHMKAAGEVTFVDVFTKPDGKSKGCGYIVLKFSCH